MINLQNIMFCFGDTLALQYIGGFKEGGKTNLCGRPCETTLSERRINFEPD
jgi:hypothetical protein